MLFQSCNRVQVWMTLGQFVLYVCNMTTKNTAFDTDWVRFKSTLVKGVNLMHAHFWKHSFERHTHETFAIGQTHSGIQAFRCRGENLSSVKGKIILFNPDEPHDGHRGGTEAFEYRMLYVEPEVIFDILRDCGFRKGCCHAAQPLIDDFESWHGLGEAINALEHPNESLRAEALLIQTIHQLFARHGDATPSASPAHQPPHWMSRVRDYIEEHYANDITVSQIAQEVQVSRVHVTRAFSSVYGVSPHVYLNSVRIRRAKSLMLAGLPVAHAAIQTGFADQSHFTRRFKGAVGVTPTAWLRAMSAMS